MDAPHQNNFRRNGLLLVWLGLGLGTGWLYWPVGDFSFVGYDDPFYLLTNTHIHGGFTVDGLVWAFGKITSGFTYWHPLSWMSHMLDCQLFGLKAGAHHGMSALYHLVNAVLLFYVLRQLTGAFWKSALVAALFAWHPLNVESVAWVTERKNLLSTFFLLLTIWFYQRYAKKKSSTSPTLDARRPTLDYSLALFFFACGLMSKPMLVTVPGILLLLDFWPLQRVSGGAGENSETQNPKRPTPNFLPLLLEKIPFLVLAIISSVITVISHQESQSLANAHVSFGIRVANVFYSYVRYLRKAFWPDDLAAIYPFPITWPVSRFVVCVLILAVISAAAIALARKRPYFLFGWLWFLGTLVPVIGLVQAGAQAMADRFAYVPLLGVFIAVVWGGTELAERYALSQNMKFTLAALPLAACLLVSSRQLPHWRNSVALFERTLAVENENPTAHYNLAYAYAQQGRTAAAKQHYGEALRLTQDYADAHNNLAALLLDEGRMAEAAAHYRAVLKSQPAHPLAHFNLAIVLEKQGLGAEALTHYAAAAKSQPANVAFNLGWANALGQAGRGPEAMNLIMKTVQAHPTSAEANYQAGNVMMMMQKTSEALGYYAQAAKLNPSYAEAHYNWGSALALSGRVPEAATHFAEAVRLKPDFAEARLSYGMALLEAGQAVAAAAQYHEALRLATAAGQTPLVEQIQSRLHSLPPLSAPTK